MNASRQNMNIYIFTESKSCMPPPALNVDLTLCAHISVSQKRHRLQRADFEGLAAADVSAGQLFVAPYHVRLRLGELGAVPFVGPPRQLRPLAPHHPGHLVLARLAALGTGQRVGALFGRFVEKITLFHGFPALHPGGKTCSRNPGSLLPQRPKPESPEGTSTPAGLPSYSYLP